MCVIAVCIKKRMSDEDILLAWDANPDGAGIAWPSKNGVRFQKGFMSPADLIRFYHEHEREIVMPHAIHFRIATHGAVCPELTHPFVISPNSPLKTEGEVPQVLMHNGIYTGGTDNTIKKSRNRLGNLISDSRILAVHVSKGGENAIDIATRMSWGRIATIDKGGIKWYGTGWHKEDGICYSNTHFRLRSYTFADSGLLYDDVYDTRPIRLDNNGNPRRTARDFEEDYANNTPTCECGHKKYWHAQKWVNGSHDSCDCMFDKCKCTRFKEVAHPDVECKCGHKESAHTQSLIGPAAKHDICTAPGCNCRGFEPHVEKSSWCKCGHSRGEHARSLLQQDGVKDICTSPYCKCMEFHESEFQDRHDSRRKARRHGRGLNPTICKCGHYRYCHATIISGESRGMNECMEQGCKCKDFELPAGNTPTVADYCICGHPDYLHDGNTTGKPCTNEGCWCGNYIPEQGAHVLCACGHEEKWHNSEYDVCGAPECDCMRFEPTNPQGLIFS